MGDVPKPSRGAVDKIFGDALPSGETDEDDISVRTEGDARERWLRQNVPPHHE